MAESTFHSSHTWIQSFIKSQVQNQGRKALTAMHAPTCASFI